MTRAGGPASLLLRANQIPAVSQYPTCQLTPTLEQVPGAEQAADPPCLSHYWCRCRRRRQPLSVHGRCRRRVRKLARHGLKVWHAAPKLPLLAAHAREFAAHEVLCSAPVKPPGHASTCNVTPCAQELKDAKTEHAEEHDGPRPLHKVKVKRCLAGGVCGPLVQSHHVVPQLKQEVPFGTGSQQPALAAVRRCSNSKVPAQHAGSKRRLALVKTGVEAVRLQPMQKELRLQQQLGVEGCGTTPWRRKFEPLGKAPTFPAFPQQSLTCSSHSCIDCDWADAE